MPGFDRTGPNGAGAMTGGGFGFCEPQAEDPEGFSRRRRPGYGRRSGGRGLQRGLHRGACFFSRRGSADGFVPRRAAGTIQPDPARPGLQAEAADLRRRLDAIEQRLAGMEGFGVEPKQA